MERTYFSKTVVPDHYDFIDGLRAIAVLLVIFFHFQLANFYSGFLGVDVFFVISGFVITEMIRKTQEAGGYSVMQFWRRRVLRIIPALYATTLITVIVSAFVYLPEDFHRNIQAAKASLLFYSNIHFYFFTDYFTDNVNFLLFLHHWSLSVEEQFYIIFPLYVALLYRLWEFRFALMILIIFSTLLHYLWSYQHNPMSAFYFLPARAWEFFAGSAIVFIPRRHFLSRIQSFVISSAGLLMIAGTSFGNPPSFHLGQLDLIWVVIGTTLAISGCLFGPETPVRRVLSLRPLRFVGKISFSLYLVHWPVYVFAQYIVINPLSPSASAALLIPTFAIAWTNWRFVEVPFRGDRFGRALEGTKLWLVLAASTSLLFGSFSLTLSNKIEILNPSPVVREALKGKLDFNPKRSTCHSEEEYRPVDPSKACNIGGTAKPTIAVWGDSFAGELAFALGNVVGQKNQSVLQLSSSSCPPVPGLNFINQSRCSSRNDKVLSFLQRHAEIDTVVLVMFYGGYKEHADSTLLAGIEKVSRALVVAGKKVIIIAPFPRPGFNVPNLRARAIYFNREVAYSVPADTHRRSSGDTGAALRRIGTASGATIFDPASAMCTETVCPMFHNGRPLYFDDYHPSIYGASKVAEMLFPPR